MSHKTPLSLEELQKLSEYQQLSPKRKALINAFVQCGGDRNEAYRITHPKAMTPKSIDAGAGAAFGQVEVRAVLNLYFSIDAADVFEKALQKAMRNPRITPSQIRALEIYAETHGLNAGLPKPAVSVPVPEPQGRVIVDKVVERDGRKLRQVVTDLGAVENATENS